MSLAHGNNKGEINMELRYKMSRRMYNDLLKTRDNEEKKMHPKDFVLKYINDTFGLRGKVVSIILED
jgi:hypothetical protein